MHKLPLVLAVIAAIGGVASMILAVSGPRNASTLPIFVIAMIITLGALGSARRFVRQRRSAIN
jgi:hypothetical protein